jgi:O-antigen ligase
MLNHATAIKSTAAIWPVHAKAAPREGHRADLKWDLLLLCVSGYLLTSVGRVHQLFPVLALLRPAILTGLLAIVIYLADPLQIRRAKLTWGPTTKYLLALLGWMILSVPGALVRGTSFDLVFDSFVKTVVMFVVLTGAVRGPRDVERLVATYLVAATVYAGVVHMRFDLGGGDNWRLGHLYYYDANDFATFAVTAMPFGLYFLHAGRGILARVLAAGALGILTLAFVKSGSRGGFVALVAVTAFVVIRYSSIPFRWRIGVTSLITVVVLAAASDRYWTQMSTILSDADYNHTDESGRMQIWSRGIGYMLQNPILGVGPHNFQAAEGTLSEFSDRQQRGVGVRWNAPHNSYLQVGAELGVPGLAIFLLLIASAFTALRRASRFERALVRAGADWPRLAPALTAALIGFVVGAFFLSLAYAEILFTLIAMAVALQKVNASRAGLLAAVGAHSR